MVRLIGDRIATEKLSVIAASQVVTPKLGVSWHTARQWIQQSHRAGKTFERSEDDVIAKNIRLGGENQELRDVNDLLKAASAFFASELDPKRRK